jgi:hypothetical protein
MPFQIGTEFSYAVVHPDTYGERWNFRISLKPVIRGLIQQPLFGRQQCDEADEETQTRSGFGGIHERPRLADGDVRDLAEASPSTFLAENTSFFSAR